MLYFRFFINLQESLTEHKAFRETVKTQKVTKVTKKKKNIQTEHKHKPADSSIPDNLSKDSASSDATDDLNLGTCCLFDYSDITS